MSTASANLFLCPDCGQPLKNHYRYCIRCGLKIVLEVTPFPDAPAREAAAPAAQPHSNALRPPPESSPPKRAQQLQRWRRKRPNNVKNILSNILTACQGL